jgi:hypothetical protein
VKALLAAGSLVNAATRDGAATPLLLASQRNHGAVVKLLLAAGADINRASAQGLTPLYVAAQEGHLEVVGALLAGGAAVNQAAADGSTPLYIAAQNGHADVVRALLWVGADASIAFNTSTPLAVARRKGHTAIAELLAHPERHTRAAAVAAQREATANRAAVGMALVLRRAGPIALPPVPPPLPPGAAPAVALPPPAAVALTVSARSHAFTRSRTVARCTGRASGWGGVSQGGATAGGCMAVRPGSHDRVVEARPRWREHARDSDAHHPTYPPPPPHRAARPRGR